MADSDVKDLLLYEVVRGYIKTKRYHDAGGIIIEAMSLTPATVQRIGAALMQELVKEARHARAGEVTPVELTASVED